MNLIHPTSFCSVWVITLILCLVELFASELGTKTTVTNTTTNLAFEGAISKIRTQLSILGRFGGQKTLTHKKAWVSSRTKQLFEGHLAGYSLKCLLNCIIYSRMLISYVNITCFSNTCNAKQDVEKWIAQKCEKLLMNK